MEKIKVRDLETPPDTSKGGILLPAPLQLEMRQLQAIPALLRLARAAKARHEAWTRETYVAIDEALSAFDFTD